MALPTIVRTLYDYVSGTSSAERTFWKLYGQWSANNAAIRDLNQQISAALTSGGSVSDGVTGAVTIARTTGGAEVSVSDLRAQVRYLEDDNESLIDRMYTAAPDVAATYFPEYFDADRAKDIRSLYGTGGSAPSYQFQVGDGGEVYRISSSGSFEYLKTIPELAQKSTQIVNDARTGHSYALTLDSAGNVTGRTDLGQFSYAEVDPERKFRLDLLNSAAAAEASLAGIELERRGQVVNVIAQDIANMFDLGRMTYEESTLNLNRINSALEQRRAERQQLFAYGVREASIRRDASGREVTVLPFARQTAGILGQATGQQFTEDDFTLDVTRINPEQAGQDVINSSAFTSPIPGLMAAIESARNAMQATVNQPLADMAVTNTLIAEATKGV